MAESNAEPAFVRIGPAAPVSPVVLSVPHSGCLYPAALLAASRVSRRKLETLEDPLVDRLVWRALATGAVAVIAKAPRAEIDLNRAEQEYDPAMLNPPPAADTVSQTARVRGGLGLVPTRIGGVGPIWLQRLTRAELDRRLDAIHRPYHAALDTALRAARDAFGTAVLLDCHSMPPRRGPDDAAIVFGDRHGKTIAPHLMAAAIDAAEASGFSFARNAPYAGGHITERHGRPKTGIHALQIEIDRACYLADDMRTAGPGFDSAARMLAAVVKALAAGCREAELPIAAE